MRIVAQTFGPKSQLEVPVEHIGCWINGPCDSSCPSEHQGTVEVVDREEQRIAELAGSLPPATEQALRVYSANLDLVLGQLAGVRR